jgi:DNA-binding NarL/FixJ family response regulator
VASWAADAVPGKESDVVLVDVCSPVDAQIVACVARECPEARLFVLAATEDPPVLLECLRAGAITCFGIERSIDEIARALLQPSTEVVFPIALLDVLKSSLASSHRGDLLTRREREVADLLEQGLPNKQIAAKLGVEISTVKNHVHQILAKLHATGRGDAVHRLRQM